MPTPSEEGPACRARAQLACIAPSGFRCLLGLLRLHQDAHFLDPRFGEFRCDVLGPTDQPES